MRHQHQKWHFYYFSLLYIIVCKMALRVEMSENRRGQKFKERREKEREDREGPKIPPIPITQHSEVANA